MRHYFKKWKKAPSLPSSLATAFYLRTCYSEVNSSDSQPGQTVISSSNSWAALKLSLKYHWSPVCWALPPSQAYPLLSPLSPFCLRAKGCRVEGQAVCKAWIQLPVNTVEWNMLFPLKKTKHQWISSALGMLHDRKVILFNHWGEKMACRFLLVCYCNIWHNLIGRIVSCWQINEL